MPNYIEMPSKSQLYLQKYKHYSDKEKGRRVLKVKGKTFAS